MIALASDCPVHIHLAEQTKEVEDCLNWIGRRPATWLMDEYDIDERWCLVHATHLDSRELERIARSGATVGLCPITEANLGDGVFPATQFLALSGVYGIGSDSNVLIGAAEELRMLEYTQRLTICARNVMSHKDGRSTGRSLFDSALQGGSRALGTPSRGLCVGAAADLVALDTNHEALADRTGDAILDGWIFAARSTAVDCVWRYGRKVVSDGRHLFRDQIVLKFRAAIKELRAV